MYEGLLSHYTEKYTSLLLKLVFKNQILEQKRWLAKHIDLFKRHQQQVW